MYTPLTTTELMRALLSLGFAVQALSARVLITLLDLLQQRFGIDTSAVPELARRIEMLCGDAAGPRATQAA
jgi:hypothetical protein